MSDIALYWDPSAGIADIAIETNDLSHDDGLETAVQLSLFLRRGEWWGDAFPDVEGDTIGSRLEELLARANRTADLASKTEEAAAEALAWLVQDGVASRVEVKVEFPSDNMWGLLVVIYRPQDEPVRFRFGNAWDATASHVGHHPTPWPPPAPSPPPLLGWYFAIDSLTQDPDNVTLRDLVIQQYSTADDSPLSDTIEHITLEIVGRDLTPEDAVPVFFSSGLKILDVGTAVDGLLEVPSVVLMLSPNNGLRHQPNLRVYAASNPGEYVELAIYVGPY